MQSLKVMAQLGILLAIYGIGELCVRATGLPVPGAIAGMGILALLLIAGWLPLSLVESAAELMTKRISLMLLPAFVGAFQYWSLVEEHVVALLVIILVPTAMVLVVTATTAVAVGRFIRYVER